MALSTTCLVEACCSMRVRLPEAEATRKVAWGNARRARRLVTGAGYSKSRRACIRSMSRSVM